MNEKFQFGIENFEFIVSERVQVFPDNSLRRRANARSVNTSFFHYGGITYLITSFDYPKSLYPDN